MKRQVMESNPNLLLSILYMGQRRHTLPGRGWVEKKQHQVEVIWMGGKVMFKDGGSQQSTQENKLWILEDIRLGGSKLFWDLRGSARGITLQTQLSSVFFISLCLSISLSFWRLLWNFIRKLLEQLVYLRKQYFSMYSVYVSRKIEHWPLIQMVLN